MQCLLFWKKKALLGRLIFTSAWQSFHKPVWYKTRWICFSLDYASSFSADFPSLTISTSFYCFSQEDLTRRFNQNATGACAEQRFSAMNIHFSGIYIYKYNIADDSSMNSDLGFALFLLLVYFIKATMEMHWQNICNWNEALHSHKEPGILVPVLSIVNPRNWNFLCMHSRLISIF